MRTAAGAILLAVAVLTAACGPIASTGRAASVIQPPYTVHSGHDPRRWLEFTPHTADVDYYGIVEGPDQAMWFTDNRQDGFVRMMVGGDAREFFMPRFNPVELTVGADGNFYANSGTQSEIARMTPTGKFARFEIPSTEFAFGGMVLGPDGNVWFTEEFRIGTITPQGRITEYDEPEGAETAETGITVGPDLNIWFADEGNRTIAKMNPWTHVVTEYPVGEGDQTCYPHAIVAARDRNLYFSCPGPDDSIGKITTSGEVTLYANPWGFSASPHDITVGPNGNVWYVGQINRGRLENRVVEFNLKTHEITPHIPPHTSQIFMWGIAGGPDGNLWITTHSGVIDVFLLHPIDVTPGIEQ